MKQFLRATANDAIHYYLYLTTEYDCESEKAQERTIAELDYGGLPAVVCLCGSTRFHEAFQKANFDETMAGKIVLSVGFYPHSSEQAHGEAIGITPEQKEELDRLHLRKVEMADEVLILNQGGYIGSSTSRELDYARSLGKVIRFLESVEGTQ